MDVKSGDSGYQLDTLTHISSAELSVACSKAYMAFTGKVSITAHFPHEPGGEDYTS